MKQISSAKFRLTYHRLEEETQVTVNGHVIGIWKPLTTIQRAINAATITADEATERFKAVSRALGEPSPQSKRDAILRRINKGG